MPKHLQNGQCFPKLEIPAVGGGALSLPGDLAESYGVILIYRGNWCPFCREQLAAFANASEALAQEGIKVLAFSVEDEPTTREVIEKDQIPFKMGHSANIEAVVGATGAYETRHPTRGRYLESTGFVLAPDAAVVTAVYSSRAIGRLVASDVIRMVSYLKSLAK
jgi:peroxiredoxin